jgi:hypothetical protein
LPPPPHTPLSSLLPTAQRENADIVVVWAAVAVAVVVVAVSLSLSLSLFLSLSLSLSLSLPLEGHEILIGRYSENDFDDDFMMAFTGHEVANYAKHTMKLMLEQ